MRGSLLELKRFGVERFVPAGQRFQETAMHMAGVGESPANDKLDSSELAAYTMVASLLLNLDETLNKN